MSILHLLYVVMDSVQLCAHGQHIIAGCPSFKYTHIDIYKKKKKFFENIRTKNEIYINCTFNAPAFIL